VTEHRPLTYKGRPVPYITAWTGEIIKQPPLIATGQGLTYAGPTEGRGRDGVLWQLWGLKPGAGEPSWRKVHGARQRRAMRKCLCQVCGGPADRDERGWLWLLEGPREDTPNWPNGEMTVHPPVCVPCAPVAAIQCPHLRRTGVVPVRVGDVVLDAVYGLRYIPGPLGLVAEEDNDVFLMSNWRTRWVVGAQLAASLSRCTVMDPGEVGIHAPTVEANGGR
jgi:hypothetical protein